MIVTTSAPPAALVPHVEAGILAPADVHIAATLCRVTGEDTPEVLLAAALAARAPRLQHVCADLRTVQRLAAADDEAASIGDRLAPAGPALWPADLGTWLAALRDSPTVAVAPDPSDWRAPDPGGAVAPLVLSGQRLYLDRLWRDELAVAAALRTRAGRIVADVDGATLRRCLDALFDGDPPDRQRLAAATGALRHLAIIAGGPGTGKTTTVARLLALLDDLAVNAGRTLPTIALAAPTGKAAQRLTASLREALTKLDRSADDPTVARLRTAEATTLHRLLGARRDSRSRFDHHAGNPLPHDVVVIDEASMVSLAHVARLTEALRPDARLVLLGDPEQLASVEAGSVLGDVVGEHGRVRRISTQTRELLAAVLGEEHLDGLATAAAATIDDAIVVLEQVHRFRSDSGIADLATAIQAGRADDAIARLRLGGDLTWVPHAVDRDEPGPVEVRDVVIPPATAMVGAASEGAAAEALRELDTVRVLCAHRTGPAGVTRWVGLIEGWLAAALPGATIRGPWYPGRPVLVTQNDPRVALVNGDVGVVVRGPDGPRVAFPDPGASVPRAFAPGRLPPIETVHAMTIHKSQGSQFRHVVVVLPEPGSPLLTRELLYTAVTRGQEHATIVGSEAAIRQAIATRALRASGLGDALRTEAPTEDQTTT